MSGAKKKLAQKEALTQTGLTEKEKKAQKEIAAKKRNTILAIVGAIVAVALVVALLVWNSGLLARHTTALEVNGHKYTVADMDYFYRLVAINAYNRELSNVQLYQSAKEQGYDMGDYTPKFTLSADLKTQYVDEEKTRSYHDQFIEDAQNEVAHLTALVDAANAEGYTLSEEAQKELDDALPNLDAQARDSGLSGRSAALRTSFGRNVTEKVYLKNLRLAILASDYSEHTLADLTDYSDEDLKAYYEENPALLNSYDYDYAFFSGTPVLEPNEDGTTPTATDEQKADAMAEAKTKAENLMRDVKAAQTATLAEGETRQSFADVALNYTTASTPRTRRLAATNFKDAAYAEWLMDSARKDGDIEIFEEEGSGYYVIQFHDAYLYDEPTVDVRHILIRAETSEDAQTNEYGVAVPSQEQMDAAHDEAEELMKQFNLGEKTATAFGELAEEHSDDGRGDDGSLSAAGGLYTSVYKGQMVEGFENWIFDPSRQTGDVGLVENAGPGYYGWHVVYFQAYHEPEWRAQAKSAKSTADEAAWTEKVDEGYVPAPTAAMSQVG